MGVLGEKIGLRGRASLFLEKLYVGNKNSTTPVNKSVVTIHFSLFLPPLRTQL